MNTKTDLRIIKTHKALCESFAALIEKKLPSMNYVTTP